MAQAQKQTRQPQDPYARRVKELTSAVQRLRGWIGTDPGRRPELVDALLELDAHRLLGHAFAATAPDAQEAVRLASSLLAEPGPIGPYTTAVDAVRCGTALVQVAVVQAAMGMSDGAGRTLDSWEDLRRQLDTHRLELDLAPLTVIWALATGARSRLAAADVAGANAYADAALARLAESGLRDDPAQGHLAVDVDRLASDCRWAAGRADEALGFLHLAKDRYDDVVDGRLDEPGRLGQVLLERLAEPAFGLSCDLADRLVATDRAELGLVTRRALIETLRGFVANLGDPGRTQLATALADLAVDLRALGRSDEAAAAATEAVAVARGGKDVGSERARAPLGTVPVDWAPLAAVAAYAPGDGATTSTAVPDDRTTAWLEAESARAHQREVEELRRARVDAERRRAADAAAAQVEAERVAAERVRAVEQHGREAAERTATDEADQTERKRRRAERLREHEAEVHRREAETRAVERRAVEQRITEIEAGPATAAQLVELERLRLEGAGSAEQKELLRQAQDEETGSAQDEETGSAQNEETGPAQDEGAGSAQDEGAGSAQDEGAGSAPADELAAARSALAGARTAGDRRAVRAALERLVEVLRPRAASESPALQAALEELAGARLRGGDLFGSRAAAKEARALGRSLR